MQVTILGSGSAGGVPMISAGWGACDPKEPKNWRTRPSILIQDGEGDQQTTILVDTSPDLRWQLLRANVRSLSGVLFTHDHADHTHGLDDLREVNRAMGRSLPIWANQATLDTLQDRFSYCFLGIEQGQSIFRPWLMPNAIDGQPFHVGPIRIQSWEQDHGWTKSLGFRFGPVAYCTDCIALPDHAFDILAGVDVFIVGALTDKPHPTHAHIDLALEWIDRVKPKQAILSHMGPSLDYQTLRQSLPDGVVPGYDGMVIQAPA